MGRSPLFAIRGSMWCRQEEDIFRVKVRLCYIDSHRFSSHFQALIQLIMFTVVKISQMKRGLSNSQMVIKMMMHHTRMIFM